MCALRTRSNPHHVATDEGVAALVNGLKVFEAISRFQKGASIAEAAEETGLTRASARRALLTLTGAGYLRHNGRKFLMTPRALRFGHAYLSSTALPQIAQPVVEELGYRTKQFISVNVLDGVECLTIASSTPRRLEGGYTRVGTRLPIFSSAAGRVLMADKGVLRIRELITQLSPIRKLTPLTETDPQKLLSLVKVAGTVGFAINDQEIEAGIQVLAVPIYDRVHRVIASLSVSTYSSVSPLSDLEENYLAQLRTARDRIGLLVPD